MTKRKSIKSNLVMEAKVINLKQHDDSIGVALQDSTRKQPFVIYFNATGNDLAIGDLVMVTIKKLEV